MESPELRRSKRQRKSRRLSDETTREMGTLHWKGKEKALLLEALKRSKSHDNYAYIAKHIKTKSVEEVKAYMQLMRRKARMAAVTNQDSLMSQTPLQKWFAMSNELTKMKPVDHSLELAKVFTLAHLEEDKPAAGSLFFENSSLPPPDFSKIYLYLSDLLLGRANSISLLSPTDAWVVHDLLQNLESQTKESDTKEQEEFMHNRYQWLMCKLYTGNPDMELDKSVANEHTGIILPTHSTDMLPSRSATTGQVPARQDLAAAAYSGAPAGVTAAPCSTSTLAAEQMPGVAAASAASAAVSVSSSTAVSEAVALSFAAAGTGVQVSAGAVLTATPTGSVLPEPVLSAEGGHHQSRQSTHENRNDCNTEAQAETAGSNTSGNTASQQTEAAAATLLSLSVPTDTAKRQYSNESTSQQGTALSRWSTETATVMASPGSNNNHSSTALASNASEMHSTATSLQSAATQIAQTDAISAASAPTRAGAVTATTTPSTATSTTATTGIGAQSKTPNIGGASITGTLNPFSVPIRLLDILPPKVPTAETPISNP